MRFFVLPVALFLFAGCIQTRFPGHNYRGVLPPISESQKVLSSNLREHVVTLAQTIGERNIPAHPAELKKASTFIQNTLKGFGYAPEIHPFNVNDLQVENISAEIAGKTRPDEIVIIGAHYDSVHGSPGANDNGTGTAAVLEIARALQNQPSDRTIRFVFFVNEEPPFFQTQDMGSLVYAKECAARKDKIVAVISMETIGCYHDNKDSQKYPWPTGMFYPSTGNFIFIIGDTTSRSLTSKVIQSFRKHAQFPSEGAAVPSAIEGVGWSDHWSFWQVGYKGVMVTDTAPFRYRFYHTAHDLPDKIDFDRTARVVEAFISVTRDLSSLR